MQQEFFGRGASANIIKVLSSLSVKRILLVTGKKSYTTCGARACFEALLDSYELSYFNGFHPNPTFEEAMAGIQICQQVGAEAILAIGGGSAIDVAKSIAAFHSRPGQEREVALGEQPPATNTLPILAVPTTAGTGSESTHFAVIYVEGKKYSLAAPGLMPVAAILDPVYTDQLPPYITACTGFDALCQAVESFWAVGATAESRRYAEKAITLLITHLEQAVNRPSAAARDQILRAANYAGRAINLSKTTAPHALSYTITSLYGTPHGHAVAMTLGAFFPFHEPKSAERLNGRLSRSEYLDTHTQLLSLLDAHSADEARDLWYQRMAACGLDLKVVGQGIADSPDVEKVVSRINLERLSNHPVNFTAEQLFTLIRSIPSA